jgi:hypothetical protein
MRWARHVAGLRVRDMRNPYHVSVEKPERKIFLSDSDVDEQESETSDSICRGYRDSLINSANTLHQHRFHYTHKNKFEKLLTERGKFDYMWFVKESVANEKMPLFKKLKTF